MSGQDFTTIQAAHDDAGTANGDTFLIIDAILSEGNISLDKSLVIIDFSEKSIIQADPDSGIAGNRVMYIGTLAKVVLVNLTIRHGVNASGVQYSSGLNYANRCLQLHQLFCKKHFACPFAPILFRRTTTRLKQTL